MKVLISVYNKKGIGDFAGNLRKLGWEIISTGGTYDFLKSAGIDVTKVSDFTGSPEILGGRVKTLHPKIFAGILARSDQRKELANHSIPKIDMVCCNLYPFKEALLKYDNESLILENIDIGGVTLLRAAAKNYHNVIVVTDSKDYDEVIKELKSDGINIRMRKKYGLNAFKVTAEYDRAIAEYFSENEHSGHKGELQIPLSPLIPPHPPLIKGGRGDLKGGGKEGFPDEININLRKIMDLRYGENSLQKAALYGKVPFKKIQGEKELSFNNIQDANAAINIVKSFSAPAAVIIKHLVPCGAASKDDILDSYINALKSDPMSAFGGIIGLNEKLEKNVAREIIKSFFEVIVAPDFSKDSLKILSGKPNLRVVKYFPFEEEIDMQIPLSPLILPYPPLIKGGRGDLKGGSKGGFTNEIDIRGISGGLLVQDMDTFEGEDWKVVTKKQPTEEQMEDLKFAWKIVRFLKSNAIAIVKNSQTYGLGSGETARVGAVNVAISKMKQFFGENEDNLVMASDAFFPFPDAVEEAVKVRVCSVVQPGGSKNDNLVIKRADELGISMVFTGRRHFLH